MQILRLDADRVVELSNASGVAVDRLSELSEGATPTIDEVYALSEVFEVDPIRLFRDPPTIGARRGTEPVPPALTDLLDIVDYHVATYRSDLEPSKEFAPFGAGSSKAAHQSGVGLGKRWDIHHFKLDDPDDDPLLGLVEETLGIPVVLWPVQGAPHGVTAMMGRTIVIWVNTWSVPLTRQRFTLAHELGHLLLDHVALAGGWVEPPLRVQLGDLEEEPERHANAFAAGLLCGDREVLERVWPFEVTPASVAAVSAGLGVSYSATLNALRSCRLVSRAEARALRGARVWQSYRDADLDQAAQVFQSGVSRRRVPGNLPRPDALELRLQRSEARVVD